MRVGSFFVFMNDDSCPQTTWVTTATPATNWDWDGCLRTAGEPAPVVQPTQYDGLLLSTVGLM